MPCAPGPMANPGPRGGPEPMTTSLDGRLRRLEHRLRQRETRCPFCADWPARRYVLTPEERAHLREAGWRSVDTGWEKRNLPDRCSVCRWRPVLRVLGVTEP